MEPSDNETIIVEKNNDWNFGEFVKFLLITAIIVLPIRFYVAQPFVVNGESMFPTFKDGQYLIVDQISYTLGKPKRGDIAIFKFPQDESKFFIKRVIGLPGETVTIRESSVYITPVDSTERFELNETYIELDRSVSSETILEDDEYFVMGDNRLQSYDSRFWGPLEKEYLVGRALFRLFPVSEINYMPGKTDYQN